MFAAAQNLPPRPGPRRHPGTPTPENRLLLKPLLEDGDPQVKQEAASAAQALRDLSATPPKTFAAAPQ